MNYLKLICLIVLSPFLAGCGFMLLILCIPLAMGSTELPEQLMIAYCNRIVEGFLK